MEGMKLVVQNSGETEKWKEMRETCVMEWNEKGKGV